MYDNNHKQIRPPLQQKQQQQFPRPQQRPKRPPLFTTIVHSVARRLRRAKLARVGVCRASFIRRALSAPATRLPFRVKSTPTVSRPLTSATRAREWATACATLIHPHPKQQQCKVTPPPVNVQLQQLTAATVSVIPTRES